VYVLDAVVKTALKPAVNNAEKEKKKGHSFTGQ
jgi:hypothetical protein